MNIDPQAWLITIPLALGMWRFSALPANHCAKTWIRNFEERECTAWQWIGCGDTPLNLARRPRARQWLFNITLASLCVSSLFSFVAFLTHSPL